MPAFCEHKHKCKGSRNVRKTCTCRNNLGYEQMFRYVCVITATQDIGTCMRSTPWRTCTCRNNFGYESFNVMIGFHAYHQLHQAIGHEAKKIQTLHIERLDLAAALGTTIATDCLATAGPNLDCQLPRHCDPRRPSRLARCQFRLPAAEAVQIQQLLRGGDGKSEDRKIVLY